ncbi:MAG: hypothetical protein UC368_03140 [Eggerthellaceae bacterium]|nr:hypothetical protein [Eggerthellaceae bacterium]
MRPDRVEVEVAVAAGRYAQTDSDLIAECLGRVPTLGRHACRNSVGPVFASVMRSTSTPHLLEHLIIDAQTRAAKDPNRVFTGTTQWSAGDDLVAHVAFSYEDDLVALDALNRSLAFLNGVLIGQRG